MSFPHYFSELDEFQHNELKGGYQSEEDSNEMVKVKEILRLEQKLATLKEEYVQEHHKETTASLRDIF